MDDFIARCNHVARKASGLQLQLFCLRISVTNFPVILQYFAACIRGECEGPDGVGTGDHR